MTSSTELEAALKRNGITLLESLEFHSEDEGLGFLTRIEKLKKEGVHLPFLNNDLCTIIREIQLTDENLNTLRRLNWDDFEEAFRHHSHPRKKKIYLNFLHFLRVELNLISKDRPLTEQSLVTEEQENDEEDGLSSDIFAFREDFNLEQDQRDKIEHFGIEVRFDYNEPSHKLTVNDFTLYFNRRLQYFSNLLKNRIDMENVVRISNLADLQGTNTPVSLIGLISDISQTKNGHYMITLEDKSGAIKCFVHKEKLDLMKQMEHFCLDEGIGVNGKVGNDIIWIDEFVIPSPLNTAELKKTESEEFVACLSDFHFGAKVFVDEAFQKLIEFFNARTTSEELNRIARRIKYIIVGGDIIEGIGIYPGQGKDARILSTELQYHEAARWLSQIPQDKCLIIIPGNHDTDRLSEPQPKLPYHKAYPLYNLPNTIFLSNPSIVRLYQDDPSGGLDFYLYHGGSIFYYADRIHHLREMGGPKVPEEVIKFLLEKRHIAPSHGATLYIPDSQNDPLVIKEMPDFFIVGHTHKLSLANYKGCTIISCGCWVEMSDYQQKMGMYPDIGKCTIVNTKTRKPQVLSFYKEKYEDPYKEERERKKSEIAS